MANTYYINTSDFQTATAVYTNNTLTTLAPDGYYSREGNFRQQLNGVLQAPQTCNPQNVPSIDIQGPTCYTVSSNTVTKRYRITIANPPETYTVDLNGSTAPTGGSIQLEGTLGNQFARVTFNTSQGTGGSIVANLRNSSGTLLSTDFLNVDSSSQSFLPSC